MRVAGIQAAPEFLDRKATLEKATSLMSDAADGGADLVAFPETFVPGYPAWVDTTDAAAWNDPAQKAAFAWYTDAAVDVYGPEFGQVVEAARDLRVFTYMGVAERSPSATSVFCSLVAIHPDEGIVSVHRKLKPTFGERLAWADGDGHGLRVHSWAGFRLSGLNCWENWMPLARTALYAQGTQLHVATWPGSPWLTKDISRFIALEGRVFVLSVGAILRAEHIPDDFPLRDAMVTAQPRYASGGTMIVAPDGTVINGPKRDEETIVYADVELSQLLAERHNFDPTGHYSRSDVLRLNVNRRRLDTATFTD
ncbi:MAG: carbon-nitrogen hydrolase family protein [Acidimicrobiia bacterium]|nr:carbon-nitrogen hydrolase family protein [Acidimicrobiia bacterium]